MKHLFLIITVNLIVAYTTISGQEYSTQLSESARVIDESLLERTIMDWPNPRLMRFADIDKAGKQDLYFAPSYYDDGCEPDVIKYGDFNRDFILDAVVIGKSDHPDYEGKLFVVIYSFENIDHPEVTYFQNFISPVATTTIINISQHAYPIIRITFTYASDDVVSIYWNGIEYITGYADGE